MPGSLADRVQASLQLADPAEQAINRVDAERLLRRIDDQAARNGLWMRGVEGDTQAQAASRLGLTGKALERRISKARGSLGLTRKAQESDRDR